MSCSLNGQTRFGVTILSPLESNGAIPVNVQDQTTKPLDSLFAQSISDFTLDIDSGVSTVTSLEYYFKATTGHGIAPGDELLLLDPPANRVLQCVAITVAVDTITIDRPIDHAFPAATTLGRIVITNMAVDGSVTPQIFSVRAGAIPTDYVRFLLTATNNTDMDYSKFAGLPALTRGLVFRIVNGFQKTVFNFKTDADIGQFAYDLRYADKAPAGEFGISSRLTFGGQDKHGVVLRISGDDVLQWVVQDDLTSLITLRVAGEGHEILA
jgi:hypothetical protein